MAEQQPIIFTHMENVYAELVKRAEPGHSGGTLKFEGSKVEAFRAVGISQGYYTRIFDSLTEMGCIEQIRRGAGHFGTIILLHHRPEYEAFAEIYQRPLTTPISVGTLRQQVENLNRRVPDIDLKGYLVSLDQRLVDIEARLEAIERSS